MRNYNCHFHFEAVTGETFVQKQGFLLRRNVVSTALRKLAVEERLVRFRQSMKEFIKAS